MTAPQKILIAEDNEKLLVLTKRALEQDGFVVVTVLSGSALMKALAHERPDLIVLDVGLPDMDGRDLLKALKKDPGTRAIPVLIWSGRQADSDRLLALKLGAEDFVEKGPPSTLAPKIKRILLRLREPPQ